MYIIRDLGANFIDNLTVEVIFEVKINSQVNFRHKKSRNRVRCCGFLECGAGAAPARSAETRMNASFCFGDGLRCPQMCPQMPKDTP